MLSFLLTIAFYPEFSRWVQGHTRIGFDGASSDHHNAVIFYNLDGFNMVTGSERIKSCKKIFWIKYKCKRWTEYYYGAIPKILVNQGSITANSGGGVLRWMVAQVPNNCDSYDYIQINGNSESSYIFDPLRVESNKRHCMFFGSNSNHSFTLYKSKLSPGKLFVENLNIPNSTVEVTENNMTIDDWNNIFLFYEKNESDTHSVVSVQSFNKTSNETVYSNFWRTSERVIEVKKIPFEYNAKFGYNSIELDNETFTYILFPDGNQVFATFINTQDIFFDNGQKLNEVLTINNNTYIGLKPKNPVQLEFYVTETNNECETVDAMINGADKQAVFDSSNLGINRKHCLILASKYDMDYTLYYSSDMNRNNVVYIRDINQNSIEHNLHEHRIHNISKTNFSLVVLNNIDNTGKFGIYTCKFSSSSVSTEGLMTGLFFGNIEHSISPNIQMKNLYIANFDKHTLNISNTEDTIIDFHSKEGFKSTIIIFNKQYFIGQNEVYDIQRPLFVRSSSGYHILYFKLILVEYGCKNSYIINGNGTSYFVNLQQTDGLICMHFVSYSDSRITVFDPEDVDLIRYGNNYMIDNSYSIERGVTLRINNTQRINSIAGVASIEAIESHPEKFSKGIFNKQFEISTYPKTTIHESREGFNEIDIQKDELVILSSNCEYYQNMILYLKSTNSLREININLEQKLRNRKSVYIQTSDAYCTIIYYFSKFDNDCYSFNMVNDKINQQYFMIAEPNKRHCIAMISTNETDMIFYTEDQVTKVDTIREYEKQTFKYIDFISNNETYIMVKETTIIGNEYISNQDNIYSEGKRLHEINGNYYIAHPGYNNVSLSKTSIIYPKENGFKVFVAFDTESDVHFIKSNKTGIISELDETLDVETQDSSIKFYLLVLPDGDYSYDFSFKPKYSQVYWNTSTVESNKKHILVLFGDLNYNDKQVIRTPEFPQDETFNVYESYIFGFNKTEISNTMKTLRTDCLIIEYISSSTKRSGIVGIYDIGFISPNYRSYDKILSHDENHKFDGFIDPVKVSLFTDLIYGPNSYIDSQFKTLVITYERDDNFNHFLYFNDEKNLMKCDHSPISKMIHSDKTFVIKSVSDYYSDTIYHLKMDKDCDTIDLLFNQYGNHFTVDPLHYKPNKKYCIATLTNEKTEITLKKYDYSDSSYSMFFSDTFNMEESFEISETKYKYKLYSMIKTITKNDCIFPYCGIIFARKSGSTKSKILHVRGFNHLFKGKSLVRQFFVAQLGHNSFSPQNFQVTTIKFPKSDKFNTFVVFHSRQYINESSKRAISSSIMNPDFISVFSGKYNIEFTVYQLAKDCNIKYNVNYFHDLFFTNAYTKENSKYCVIHLGTGEMTTVLFKDTKTSDLNKFSYYDSFSMESTPVIIKDEFTTLKYKKSFIIEYKVGESNPYGYVGISHSTPLYFYDKFDYPDDIDTITDETGSNTDDDPDTNKDDDDNDADNDEIDTNNDETDTNNDEIDPNPDGSGTDSHDGTNTNSNETYTDNYTNTNPGGTSTNTSQTNTNTDDKTNTNPGGISTNTNETNTDDKTNTNTGGTGSKSQETETNVKTRDYDVIISAKFGRNKARVSKYEVTTVITPVSSGKNGFVAFLNHNKFSFPGMSDIREIIMPTGSFKVKGIHSNGILEFVIFALEKEDSTLDFIINQDKKQYLIDVGYKYFISNHLVVFIGSEDCDVISYLSFPISNNDKFKIDIYFSYTMDDKLDVIRETKLLHNVTFAVFRIVSNDIYKNSFIGISSIIAQKQIDKSHVSGNFHVSAFQHFFTSSTSVSPHVSLRPEIFHPRISIVNDMSTVKISPNSLVIFDPSIGEDYSIAALSNKVKINLTEMKKHAIVTKKETEISVKIIKKDTISRIPMNIYKLDYLQDKCNEMIISGGSEDITLCSKYRSRTMRCKYVISKDNKTCIFKSFNSLYSRSEIKSNKINIVETFTPDGTPIKQSMEDSNLSINSFFVSVINPPEDIDEQDFILTVNTKNQNNEIELPYSIQNDEIYEFEGKYMAGAISGWTIFAIFLIVVGVAIYSIYTQTKAAKVSAEECSESNNSPEC